MIKNKFNFLILIFSFIIILIGSFAKYTGVNHIFYIDKINFLMSNDLLYKNDLYFETKAYEFSSIIFLIIKYFKINFLNDFVGYSIYLFFVIISFYWIYIFVKKNLNLNFNLFLIIAFILLWNNSVLLSGIQSSIVSMRFGSPSFFANCFLFLLIFLICQEKWFYSMLLLSLMILISIKTAFLISGICILFFLIKNKDYKKIIYIFLPIFTVLIFLYLNINLNKYSYDEKLFQLNEALKIDQEESDFQNYSLINLIFFYSSFFFIYFTIYKEKNNFFLLSKITIIVSLVYSIFIHLYFSKLYIYYPNVNFSTINPVRNMESYNIIFSILFVLFIIRSKIFASVKISLIFIYFIIGFSRFSDLVFFISIFIIFLNILYSFSLFILKKNLIYLNFLITNNYQLITSFLLIIVTLVWSLKFINYRTVEFDSFLFENENKWTTLGNISLETDTFKKNLYKLRNCDDFILHYVWFDTHMYYFHNYLANKSRYLSNASHLRNNLKLMKLHVEREKTNLNIINKISNKKNLRFSDIENFQNLSVVLIVETQFLDYFLNKYTIKNPILLNSYLEHKYEKVNKFNIDNSEFYLKNIKNTDYNFLIFKYKSNNYPFTECINNFIL